MLGNWSQFKQDDNGDGQWNLEQSRTHNDVNELTAFTAGAWKTPQHEPCGNETGTPRPGMNRVILSIAASGHGTRATEGGERGEQ